MVVAAILGLALALPTGALFGVGYGTGVRIGYEQVYPLLFPVKERGSAVDTANTLKSLNQIYNAIGGKEASQMGVANGIISKAVGELKTNPDFQALGELESNASGATQLSSQLDKILEIQTKSLQESSYRNRYGIDLTVHMAATSSPPITIIDQPLGLDSDVESEPELPVNITDKFGYANKTPNQLLQNQPSQMSPRPANFNERITNWNHYFQLAVAKRDGDKKAQAEKEKLPSFDTDMFAQYFKKRNNLGETAARSARDGKINSSNQTIRQKQKNININDVKQLLNFISLKRNSSTLKVKLQASKDYKTGYWKKFYYKTHASYRA